MKLKPCSKEKIIEIYINSNRSLPQASFEIGCSTRTLKKWMDSYKIKSKPKFRFGIRKGAKFAILGDREWLKKQLETKSFRELAEEVGTTEGNISDRVKRYGLRPDNWSHSSYTKQGLKKKFPNGRFGKESSNWKNGITTLYNLIRENSRERDLFKDCLKRDNFTCQDCRNKGGELEVHHIEQLAKIIKDNNIKNMKEALKCPKIWDPNNLITLCVSCHKKTKSHSNKNF